MPLYPFSHWTSIVSPLRYSCFFWLGGWAFLMVGISGLHGMAKMKNITRYPGINCWFSSSSFFFFRSTGTKKLSVCFYPCSSKVGWNSLKIKGSVSCRFLRVFSTPQRQLQLLQKSGNDYIRDFNRKQLQKCFIEKLSVSFSAAMQKRQRRPLYIPVILINLSRDQWKIGWAVEG